MRARRAWPTSALALVLVAGAAATARAQFVTTGDKLDQPAEQNVEETAYSGRLSLATGLYSEDDGAPQNGGSSPDLLLWADLRGRLQASHIKGGRWNLFGDLRIRYTPDTFEKEPQNTQTSNDGITTSRGLVGGPEYELKEAFFTRRGLKLDVSLGRMVLRDVDAMTIDGFALGYHKGLTWEAGFAAGLFPNPYSRSLGTDYAVPDNDTRTIVGYPAAVAAWAGYRTVRAYGALGAGAIFPRNRTTNAGVIAEDPRTMVTSRGYFRISPVVSFFHYLVVDLTGAAGAQLTNLQGLVTWRPRPRLTVELGASHMSTYAIETFLRDLLEAPIATGVPGRPINNLDVARMAADEARVGANYSILEKRIDVFGAVRYRRRDLIKTPKLEAVIEALPADTQIDVSAGIRKKRALANFDLGANVAVIRGDRTSSYYVFGRANRTFLDDRLDLDLDLGYINYKDGCEGTPAAPADPTCTGFSAGSTIRAGFSVVFRKSERWLLLADYHYGKNSGTVMNAARPDVTEHTGMLRVQYSY
jgi:hypothetical protein